LRFPTHSHHPSAEAVKKSADGLVAGVSSSVGDAIGSAVSGTLGAVGGAVASFFGFDRPRTVAAPTRVKPDALFGIHQSAGLDDSSVVGLDPGRTGQMVPDAGGSPDDEMFIARLASNPSMLDTFTWDTTNADDSLLYSIPLDPRWLPVRHTNPDVVYPTSLAKAATPFRAWRGSLRYKVYVIASSFHSARLRVVFKPQADAGTTDFDDGLARIIDIQGSTEFTIAVPFIWPALYAQGSIGTLDFQVETPVAEIGPVPNIPMTLVVYVAGGDDLVLKDPTGPLLIPVDTFLPAAEADPRADFTRPFDPLGAPAQSVRFDDPLYFDAPVHVTDLIHRPQPWLTRGPFDAANFCWRLFLYPHVNAIKWQYGSFANAALTTPTGHGIDSHFTGIGVFPLVPYDSDTGVGACIPSLWDHFADCYRFQRGGVRLKLLRESVKSGTRVWCGAPGALDYLRLVEDIPGVGDNTIEKWPYSPAGGTGNVDVDGVTHYDQTPGTVQVDFGSQVLGEWEVPYSSNRLFVGTAVRPNSVQSQSWTTALPPRYNGTNTLVAGLQFNTTPAEYKSLLRSTADDYRLYNIRGSRPSFYLNARGTMVFQTAPFGKVWLPPT